MNTPGKLKKKIEELEELLRAKDGHIKALYEIIDAHGIPRDAVNGLRTVYMFEPADGFSPDAPKVCGNCKYYMDEVYAWGHQKQCFISGRQKEPGKLCNQLKSVSSDTEAAKCQKKAR